MPRQSSITQSLIAEVAARRAAGEPWKKVAADLRARGLPASRNHLWRFLSDVPEHRGDCAMREEQCIA